MSNAFSTISKWKREVPIKIYAISGAPSSWRVLLALTFKQLDYEVRYLSLDKQEHKSDDYLKINPRGAVPTLVTKSITIRDSIAILAWLDRAYTDIPLFGHTPEQASYIWQITMEANEHLRNGNKELLIPIFFQGAETKNEKLEQAAINQRAELEKLEALLNYNDFIAGKHPCAADAVCFPEVRILKNAFDTKMSLMTELGFKTDFSDFPHIATWIERIEAFKGVKKTMPPHWE